MKESMSPLIRRYDESSSMESHLIELRPFNRILVANFFLSETALNLPLRHFDSTGVKPNFSLRAYFFGLISGEPRTCSFSNVP